jgi:peptidylprolyl isomerase
MRRLLITSGLVSLLLVSAACASDTVTPGDGGSPTTTAAATKPEVKVPDGPPPTTLVINDLIEGTGPEVKAGDTAVVQYVGVSYSTGKQFDASWDRGSPPDYEPFAVENVGMAQVIDGWNEGIPGMKVGGRRQLIIPPDLAYGPDGRPPVIGPNETLIFVIDLLEIQ